MTVVQPVESHYTAVLRPSAPNICAVMFLFVIRIFVRDSVKKQKKKKEKRHNKGPPLPNLRESTCERLNKAAVSISPDPTANMFKEALTSSQSALILAF